MRMGVTHTPLITPPTINPIMQPNEHRIPLVDDDVSVLKALRRVLSLTPCVTGVHRYKLLVDAYDSPKAALTMALQRPYDLVLSDYRMPGMSGTEFLTAFREIQPHAARLILSGYADLNGLIKAINEAGIQRFIAKPWNDYELVSAIAQALALRELTLENERLADQARLSQGTITSQEIELKRLEFEEPGITHVEWDSDGSVMLFDPSEPGAHP
jgi:two-component system, probable response regulator PhcQ